MKLSRRSVLQMGAAALAAEAFGETIARALAISASSPTGTIRDVEHVVILMQENRSFDHYFGALRGVRGFSDPRPLMLPNGDPVWKQPNPRGGTVAPFHLDTRATSAAHLASLDHSWKGSHARWKNHDAWIAAKTAMTMGYFTRADLPFYYALADAFTICDAYYCSIFGPTSPNRNFLFTGTSGLSAGYDGVLAVRNSYLEFNETALPQNDSRLFTPLQWRTYAQRLEEAGVSWKVYQEYDNYGDNSLAFFKDFRGPQADARLVEKGRGCAPGSNKDNAKASRGEHLIGDFANDVRAGRLPQVSWVVAPTIMCEHPSASPGYGQSFTARLLAALVGAPEVYAKTVFLLNYDENDGFFDHVAPYLPATGSALGASTVDTTGENYRGEPVGLGPRVPMLIVSPWSKGGWVNSQVFDHTSVLQFLEQRFGVHEPNISAWRRTVCGDLTSAFDFATPDAAAHALPITESYIADADATRTLPAPILPQTFSSVAQERGQRPARALPYAFEAACEIDASRKTLALKISNKGAAGVALNVFTANGSSGPWFFTVEAGKSLRHELLIGAESYDLTIYGPNGFLRRFRGQFQLAAAPSSTEPVVTFEANAARVLLPATMIITHRAYVANRQNQAAGETQGPVAPAREEGTWSLEPSAGWYDFEITSSADPSFLRRFAGHVETGAPSVSDPMLG
jgi:phospholipase C